MTLRGGREAEFYTPRCKPGSGRGFISIDAQSACSEPVCTCALMDGGGGAGFSDSGCAGVFLGFCPSGAPEETLM